MAAYNTKCLILTILWKKGDCELSIMIMTDNDISIWSFSKSRSMNFNFPQKSGTGIRVLLPHVTSECVDLIEQMCAYDPDER